MSNYGANCSPKNKHKECFYYEGVYRRIILITI